MSGFAYAQARVQARFAQLPDEALWQRLGAPRGLAAFLEEARQTPLGPWVAGLSRLSPVAHIERVLAHRLHGCILEASRWVPAPWQVAVRWSAWLPELPLLDPARAGLPLPPWALDSPLLGTRLAADGDPRQTIARAGGQPLLEAAPGISLALAWATHWRNLWPDCPRAQRAGLDHLLELVAAHGRRFMMAAPEQGWPMRRALGEGLRREFRRATLQPGALFAWLALVALALERLRGALVVRALYAEEPASPPSAGGTG